MPRVPCALAVALAAVLLGGGGGAAAEAGEELTEDERCLALSMYWEAKNGDREDMIAVGSVVLNRIEHEEFPGSACEVVYEGGETPPCQFTWWCDGESDEPTEAEAWALARELAEEMLSNPPQDPTGGALFFHAADTEEPWQEQERTRTAQVGGHVFYR